MVAAGEISRIKVPRGGVPEFPQIEGHIISLLFPDLVLNENGFLVVRFAGRYLVAGSTTSTCEDLICAAWDPVNLDLGHNPDFKDDREATKKDRISFQDEPRGVVDRIWVQPTPLWENGRRVTLIYPLAQDRSKAVLGAAIYTQEILQLFMEESILSLSP